MAVMAVNISARICQETAQAMRHITEPVRDLLSVADLFRAGTNTATLQRSEGATGKAESTAGKAEIHHLHKVANQHFSGLDLEEAIERAKAIQVAAEVDVLFEVSAA